MKSPFPGMDPYLEARWSNVHVLMIGAITAAMNQSLPTGLQARPEEEIRIESLAGERLQSYRGDVTVLDRGSADDTVKSHGGIAVAEPIEIPYAHAPLTLRNVRIVDTRQADRVVTVIEVLSPWNKLPGRLNQKYKRKLRSLENAETNWVEIDLLRGSRGSMLVRWRDVPRRADYLVLTYRAVDEKLMAYPIGLRERLPLVEIPLRQGDTDAVLDLQTVLDRVYVDGGFGLTDYSKPPKPPVSSADFQWAAGLIADRKM